MESRSETLRPTDAVKKRQGDDFSVRADNLQIRPCDRLHLMRLGVSGILTDFPARLHRLRHRQSRKDARRLVRHARQ
jgi:hypothetical protein